MKEIRNVLGIMERGTRRYGRRSNWRYSGKGATHGSSQRRSPLHSLHHRSFVRFHRAVRSGFQLLYISPKPPLTGTQSINSSIVPIDAGPMAVFFLGGDSHLAKDFVTAGTRMEYRQVAWLADELSAEVTGHQAPSFLCHSYFRWLSVVWLDAALGESKGLRRLLRCRYPMRDD